VVFREKLLLLKPKPRRLGQAAVAGFLYMATMLTFLVSIENTTIANAILLQTMSPIYVVILSRVFLRERVSRGFLFSLVLGLAGCGLIIHGDYGGFTLDSNLLGDAMALLSGVAFGAYTVVSGYLGPRFRSSTQLTFWAAFFGMLMMAWSPFASPGAYSANSWLLLAVFGVALTGLPLLMFNVVLKRIKAATASLLLLLLPVIHSTYAFIFLSEVPAAGTFIGGALTIAAVALALRQKELFQRPSAIAA
jgi:drug/metabolite transporter (DMT)-like permease